MSVSRAFSLRLHRPPCMLAVTRTSHVQSAPRPIRRARNDVPTGRKNQAAVSPEAIIIEKKRFSIHMSSHCDCIRVFRECKREIKWLVWGSKKRHKKTHFRDTFWSPLADTIYKPMPPVLPLDPRGRVKFKPADHGRGLQNNPHGPNNS